jgi:hypothetical protein
LNGSHVQNHAVGSCGVQRLEQPPLLTFEVFVRIGPAVDREAAFGGDDVEMRPGVKAERRTAIAKPCAHRGARRVRGRGDADPLVPQSQRRKRGFEQGDARAVAGGRRVLSRDRDEGRQQARIVAIGVKSSGQVAETNHRTAAIEETFAKRERMRYGMRTMRYRSEETR